MKLVRLEFAHADAETVAPISFVMVTLLLILNIMT
jgi:hypothetical protein